MTESEKSWDFLQGALLGLLFGFMGCVAAIDISHKELGTKGEHCFANHTCRTGNLGGELVCLHGDGHEPGTCVTEKRP